jgi:hypothetical protein
VNSRALVLILFCLPAFAQEWVNLFDGKTPTLWRDAATQDFPFQSWNIENGCLHSLPRAVRDGFQDIITRETYDSFEFEFEWKMLPGGNSGVKYFIRKVDQRKTNPGLVPGSAARGFEFQLIDDDGNEDAKSRPSKVTGSVYGLVAPSTKAVHRLNEFNRGRLVVRGTHAEHWVNGVKVLEVDLGTPELRAKFEKCESGISLQHHGGSVWFRNLRVRRIN